MWLAGLRTAAGSVWGCVCVESASGWGAVCVYLCVYAFVCLVCVIYLSMCVICSWACVWRSVGGSKWMCMLASDEDERGRCLERVAAWDEQGRALCPTLAHAWPSLSMSVGVWLLIHACVYVCVSVFWEIWFG